MLNVKVLMKSGAVIEFNCDSIETQVNNSNGILSGYSIKGLDQTKGSPMYINVSEVSAIYVVDRGDKEAPVETEEVQNTTKEEN